MAEVTNLAFKGLRSWRSAVVFHEDRDYKKQVCVPTLYFSTHAGVTPAGLQVIWPIKRVSAVVSRVRLAFTVMYSVYVTAAYNSWASLHHQRSQRCRAAGLQKDTLTDTSGNNGNCTQLKPNSVLKALHTQHRGSKNWNHPLFTAILHKPYT